jgi:hypothetical protein
LQEIGNAWNEALKEEGIDAQTYEQLYQSDPEHAKDLMRQGMKHLATGLKRGRDGKGRFTKQSPQQGRQQSPDAQRLADIKEKAKTGTLTENEELDVISALFPGGL